MNESTPIKSFKDLRVYQSAFASALEVHRFSLKWPAEEKFAMTGQIQRCSKSICATLGESWAKRRYRAHFVSKLSDATAEAFETGVWLDFAQALGYLSVEDHGALAASYDRIQAA